MKTLNFFIELSATLFENFIILESFNKIFECKYTGLKKISGFISFIFIITVYVTILNKYFVFEGWLNLITILLSASYGMFFLKGNNVSKLLTSIILFAIILCINLAVTNVLSYFFKMPLNDIMSAGNSVRILTLFSTKFLFFIATRIFIGVFRRDNIQIKKSEIIITVGLFIISHIIGLSIIEVQLGKDDKNIYSIVSALCIIIMNVFVFYVFRKLSAESKNKLRISMLELQLSEHKTMIEDTINIGKEIKKTEHDIKHHLLSILGSLEDNKKEEAEKYVRQLLGRYETSIFKYIYIENTAINSIINFKISRCHSNNIDIKLCIESDFNAFDDLDICVLLSNLLDNAIEASLEIKHAKIELYIQNEKNYLCILVRNRIEKSVLDENRQLQTTKSDKENHGIGLYSISQIVEKYDGMKNFYEKEEWFIADIWLKKSI